MPSILILVQLKLGRIHRGVELTEAKVTIIGAGSAEFSMTLVRDLCLRESLKGSTICFMDIDESRLDVVYGLATRYARETKAELKFEKALERRGALQGADFVINTALVGGHSNEEEERRVGEECGYYRGMNFGVYLHQLALMLGVARDVEDLCRDAWLIQASNPVFDGCTLITRETRAKAIGLCHGHYGAYQVARVIGIDPKEVSFQAPGVNHCIWMTRFLRSGKDAYPLIDEWIAEKSEEYWRLWDGDATDVQMSPAAVSLYKMFGLFPIGDTPRFAGAWWHHTDLETKKRWFNKYGGFDSEIGWSHYLSGLDRRMEAMFQLHGDSSALVSKEFPPEASGEQHVPIIDALVNDNRGCFQVNVPNGGALEGFGGDVVVEVPGIVSARGVQAVKVGKLPRRLTLHILRTLVMPMEQGLEAFLTRDKMALLDRILLDHRTRSYEQAQRLVDAILALPFNEDLRDFR